MDLINVLYEENLFLVHILDQGLPNYGQELATFFVNDT